MNIVLEEDDDMMFWPRFYWSCLNRLETNVELSDVIGARKMRSFDFMRLYSRKDKKSRALL